jgi:hypothetical protein
MESMLGFRQDLGFAGSVQSVAAVSIHPDIQGSEGEEGLDEAAIRTWETLHMGDEFDAEVGSTEVVARFGSQSADTTVAALPEASVDWRDGNSSVGYRMATMLPTAVQSDEAVPSTWLPAVSIRGGELVLSRGMHQEISWERKTDASSMSVVVFADNIRNPIVEAMAHFSGDTALPASEIFDRASGLLRTAGPNFSSQGMVASVERQLPGGSQIRVSYANGNALVVPALPRSAEMTQVLGTVHPRRAQTYSISLSGTLEGTGTRWRASYRWQPEETVTEVAPYAMDAAEPYLNLRLRQPIHVSRDGSTGIEALLDVRNLLAQGYRPFLLNDGSMVVFANEQRGIRGGLAFTF